MNEVENILTQKPIVNLIKIALYRNPIFVINIKKVCKLFNETYDLGGCIFNRKQSQLIIERKALVGGAYSLDLTYNDSINYLFPNIFNLKIIPEVNTIDLSGQTLLDLRPFLSTHTLILRHCFILKDVLNVFSNKESNVKHLDLSDQFLKIDINPILKGNVEWLKVDCCQIDEIIPDVCRTSKLKRISLECATISQKSLDALKLIKNIEI